MYGNAPQTEFNYRLFGDNALKNAAPTIRDPRAAMNLANEQNILGQYGNLTNYYQNVLSGKAPSLAAMQAQAGEAEALAAEQSMAASARGPLSGALAQRNAAMQGAQTVQNAAFQGVQGRIQEEQGAALGLGGALNNQGQFVTAQQGQTQNVGINQAQLQEQQNQLNQQGSLAYANLGQQTALAQLQAGEEYGNAQLAAQGQGQQLSEFNAQQQNNFWDKIWGGGTSALGSAFGSSGGGSGSSGSDVKLQEPGGRSAMTLREEPGFLLLRNDRTGELRKVATEPLSEDEHRQAMAPHGAGPLGSKTGPGYLYAHDLPIGDDSYGRAQLADALAAKGLQLPPQPPQQTIAQAFPGAIAPQQQEQMYRDAKGTIHASDLSIGGDSTDTASLADAMQQSAGAADAYGNYTPDAGTPTGIAGVMQGSNMGGAGGPNYARMAGQGLQQAGGQMMQNGSGGVGPTNIPGMPAQDDPNSYGVQSHGSNASAQLMRTAASIAVMAALA
jgi:hypothetical protein